MRHVVVVGNGIAGLTAAETLRSEGYAGEMTIIGAETYPAYSRPALSKAALLDLDEDLASHFLPAPEHGAAERLGVSATRLDLPRREVEITGGEWVPFDGLVIASGTRASRLSSAPAELTLRGIDDALELRRRLADRPDVVVIGGGALAMEVASGAVKAGCRVTLVSRRTPMLGQAGEVIPQTMAAAALDAGIRLVRSQGVAVEAADPGRDGGARVILDNETIEVPLVVSAIGDEANVGWLAGSGLLTDGELQVDTRGRVVADGRVVAGVVAAGDVAAFPTAHGVCRVPLWTSAIEQAKVAAQALMRGDDAPELSFQSYFWTEQFGISLKVCGELPVSGMPEIVSGSLEERSAVLRWQHDDGTATSAALGYRISVPKLRALTRPVGVAA
ncbi:MAG: FAD-dependent oxidoreductase [Microbacteriaceae bacterium]|nr:FAD-dependent oxidoreductase [Microbacteriaceae bacterium]